MGGGHSKGVMQRFAIVDENSDERIGADEAAAWRESVFAAMDADNDNELTMDEYMTIRMGKQEGKNPEKQAKRQAEKKARFKPMDADNSGQLSLGEFLFAGKARFEAADTDGDGIVTPWEFRANRRSQKV